MTTRVEEEALRAVEAASDTAFESWLHSLSQPLTSVSLALSLAAAPITEVERTRVLQEAQIECLRAIEQVKALRGNGTSWNARTAIQGPEVQA